MRSLLTSSNLLTLLVQEYKCTKTDAACAASQAVLELLFDEIADSRAGAGSLGSKVDVC